MLQYQFYWYNTVRYYSSTSPTDMIQSTIAMDHSNWYDTVRYYSDTRPCSPLLPKYQSYWYPSIHYCPNTSPIDTSQYTTAPGLPLPLRYSTLCPSTSLINKSQSTTAPVQVLLIQIWYVTVHCWPRISLTHTRQSTTALIPVLLIPYSTLYPQYLFY